MHLGAGGQAAGNASTGAAHRARRNPAVLNTQTNNHDDSNSPMIMEEKINCPGFIQAGDVKLSLKVDKLTLLIDLYPCDHGYIDKLLSGLKYNPDAAADGIVPAGWSAKKGSPVALDLKVPTSINPLIWSTANGARLQQKVAKGGKPYLRLEIHPLGLTPIGSQHLLQRVLNYHLLLDRSQIVAARVSRVDIAMDLHGVRLRDFAWQVPNRRLIRPYVRNGILETIYFGSPKHGAPCLYDKGIEQDVAEAWTRVEMRPKPNVPLAQLSAIENPFLDLGVFDVLTGMGSSSTALPFRKASLAQAQLTGTRGLVESYPDTCGSGALVSPRRKLKNALVATIPDWWRPDEVWKLWPDALSAALPGIVDQ